LGTALPIASRTIRRCTPTFLATPAAIVPIPNSYSRRICSNHSTLALQSNESPPFGLRPNQSTRSSCRVGHIKPPNWAGSDYRNHALEKPSYGHCSDLQRANSDLLFSQRGSCSLQRLSKLNSRTGS
jgi:hypothetical protein